MMESDGKLERGKESKNRDRAREEERHRDRGIIVNNDNEG